jgi:AbrB family looped-hinge helix DNA binding protein
MSCEKMPFYGAVTVGERGQIVIPAEARAALDIQPGEKLLVLQHPIHQGLVIFRIESVREFMDEIQKTLEMAHNAQPEDPQ